MCAVLFVLKVFSIANMCCSHLSKCCREQNDSNFSSSIVQFTQRTSPQSKACHLNFHKCVFWKTISFENVKSSNYPGFISHGKIRERPFCHLADMPISHVLSCSINCIACPRWNISLPLVMAKLEWILKLEIILLEVIFLIVFLNISSQAASKDKANVGGV